MIPKSGYRFSDKIMLQSIREAAMRACMRIVASIAALLLTLMSIDGASAQSYPSRPVRIIVPFAPGGVTDIMARLLGAKLSERLGQPFYIENHPGAGGNIGMGMAARAEPDGHSILFVSSSYVANPSLYNNPGYDPKDFTPVIKAAATPNLWFVHPSLPAKSMKELIDLIKASPGKYNVASPGLGTTPHLGIELMRLALNLDYVMIQYSGGGPAVQSKLAGTTLVQCSALANSTGLLKDGQLRGLGVASKKRSAALPDIPTLEEQGITEQNAETMQGILVPAATPKPIVELLQKEIDRIVKLPEISEKMVQLGFDPEGGSSADFDAYVRSEIARWKKVIEDAKIKKI
jgi:tripartite-type tricarboxylate transporter receptor subunit TctC